MRDFESWLELVDRALEAIAGVSMDDIPDVEYNDLWHEGLSPKAAAMRSLVEAGWAA